MVRTLQKCCSSHILCASLSLTLPFVLLDADHSAVPNVQLIKEDPEMASLYKNKSVAEQHSFDICWDLLMSHEFAELRRYLFSTKEELVRFRQVVVNVVMATGTFFSKFVMWKKGLVTN